jgi:7-carboxy-7-deazaguanine synthase
MKASETVGSKHELIPMVEIFETVEGEGTRAGYPTVFVRLFGCNLRCTWCDTTYSYPPSEAELWLSKEEIAARVRGYKSNHVCLTGGEPLMYREKSLAVINALLAIETLEDIHIETNGAIALDYFMERVDSPIVRYIMDFKLPDSGEMDKMNLDNLALLRQQDELKFVIGSEADFMEAKKIIDIYKPKAVCLFSPVWETMHPRKLVALILEHGLSQVKLNMQLHKIIWDPKQRGV